ncbi:pentapeptide repeat-containing protein [Stieleria marina]|uniref:Pentapeptide repeats (8 copies) n=1 Tax=Stieleria marina TaxID=1930275 RepID=A0A517NN93_9BACT|nr:Pentapeptide repeats (8 copies) [Planctomycetes bacterium K23_9]
MLLTMFLAIGLGWFRAVADRNRARKDAWEAKSQLRMLDQYIKPLLESPKQREQNRGRGFLSGMNLDGCDLRGISLTTGAGAFQSVSLQGAKLQNATISCGVSSFQQVSFDRADLTNAKLTATGSSFQLATFVGAKLVGTQLIGGNGAVFQANSFRGADLTNASFVCSGSSAFQIADIDSAVLVGTDLSSIDPENLRKAYFVDPPTYSLQTQFPAGFDPQFAGWILQELPAD